MDIFFEIYLMIFSNILQWFFRNLFQESLGKLPEDTETNLKSLFLELLTGTVFRNIRLQINFTKLHQKKNEEISWKNLKKKSEDSNKQKLEISCKNLWTKSSLKFVSWKNSLRWLCRNSQKKKWKKKSEIDFGGISRWTREEYL